MPYIKNLISSSIFIQYDTPRAVLSSFLAVTLSEVTNGQMDSHLFELQIGVSVLSD
jgi:hypothetical protein